MSNDYKPGDRLVLKEPTTWHATLSTHVKDFKAGDEIVLKQFYDKQDSGVTDQKTGDRLEYWRLLEVNGDSTSNRYVLVRDLPPLWEPVTDDEMAEVMNLLSVRNEHAQANESVVDKVRQILINAAELGDELDPMDLWNALGENPDDHLSDDAKDWWR